MKKKLLLLLLGIALFTNSSYSQKWTKTEFSSLKTGDKIIIADLTSCVAIKNSILDKSAGVQSITFNDDKTEITSDVTDADEILWEIDIVDSEFIFYVPNTEKKSWFYCTNGKDDNTLKIRKTTAASNVGEFNRFIFNTETGYLTTTQLDETMEQRMIGVYHKDDVPYEWRAYRTTTNIKNTVTAVFRLTDSSDTQSTSISNIEDNSEKMVDVYNILGQRMKKNVTMDKALDGLSKGIYIINGKRYYNR